MERMVELIAEFNTMKTENEKLKNSCLEYEVYKEAMAVCCKEKDELISKYRNYKAEIMQKVKTMENELATNTEVIHQLMNEVKLIKIENTNLKKELAQQKSNNLGYISLDYVTTRNEASHTDNKSELENSHLDVKEKENFQENGQNEVIKTGRKRSNCNLGGQIKTIQSVSQGSSSTCKFCNKVLKNKRTLKAHIERIHSGKELHKCEFCPKEFIDPFNYKRHVYFLHREINNSKVQRIRKVFENNAIYSLYTCPVCQSQIRSFYNYRRHVLCKHNKIKDVKIKNLLKHLNLNVLFTPSRTADNSSFTCDICKKVFLNKPAIRSHVIAVHSDERYKCRICSKEIKTLSNYRAHLYNIHKQENIRFI